MLGCREALANHGLLARSGLQGARSVGTRPRPGAHVLAEMFSEHDIAAAAEAVVLPTWPFTEDAPAPAVRPSPRDLLTLSITERSPCFSNIMHVLIFKPPGLNNPRSVKHEL